MRRWRPLPALLGAGSLMMASALYCPALPASPRPTALAAEEKPDAGEPELRVPTDAERKAAIASIEAQLKAFKQDDYEKAAKYQTTGLRRNFRSAAEFRQMMREAYPQFANYKTVTFGEARCDKKGDLLLIQATVTGQDGVTVRAVYQMVREEGEYRVGGVAGGMPRKFSPKETT
jgi:uncharacterized protein DUF4864